jgi:hypothetical protein
VAKAKGKEISHSGPFRTLHFLVEEYTVYNIINICSFRSKKMKIKIEDSAEEGAADDVGKEVIA